MLHSGGRRVGAHSEGRALQLVWEPEREAGLRGGGLGKNWGTGTEPSLSSGAWGIFAFRNKGMEIVLGTIPSPA